MLFRLKYGYFWKTIYTDGIFANVEKFIDTLEQIDDFNSKAKSSNKYPSRSKKR